MIRYRAISYTEFKSWMDSIGFVEVDLPDTMEFAFERAIHCSITSRFKIRILSSVDKRSMMTRESGNDAIRISIIDTATGFQCVDWTVYRTAGAHQNTVQRARDAYAYVSKHPEHHCSCGFLMAERKGRNGKFLGCTAFPVCKETKKIP